jgi:hypothetical protein
LWQQRPIAEGHASSQRSGGAACGALQTGWTDMQCFEDIDTKNPTLKALDLILAAWDEGVDTGVEPQQMAYAALFTALTDLVAIYGENAVVHLTRGLEKRVVEGEFTLARRDQ